MPRADRGVAQRYAARKRKKRVGAGRGPAGLAETHGASRPVQSAPRRVENATTTGFARSTPTTAAPGARVAPRRTFASYAEEYRYVLGDLRRVGLVGGGLLLGLILLSFILR